MTTINMWNNQFEQNMNFIPQFKESRKASKE